MKTITRKTMLYKTGVEYGDYTMNHVFGCAHGCKFPCYAYLMKKRYGQVEDYEQWTQPLLVGNTLELLDDEIPRLKDNIKSVHLCFTTDPFMNGYPEVTEMSVAAIRKLNDAGIKCTTLTKGYSPIELADLSRENEYGITLVTLDEEYRKKTEPGAASLYDRWDSLEYLHNQGRKTWVSIEPYPTPNMIEQSFDALLRTISFVDRIVFGRANYSAVASAYPDCRKFYDDLATQCEEFCRERGIECHIKAGTKIEDSAA